MSDNDLKKVFSQNLNNYLTISKKNQIEVANDLGISTSTFSSWCTGQKMPRMDKIEMLANYFGIEKSDLIEKHDSNEDETLKILNRNARKMTVEQRKQLLDIAKAVFKEAFND